MTIQKFEVKIVAENGIDPGKLEDLIWLGAEEDGLTEDGDADECDEGNRIIESVEVKEKKR